MQLNTTSTVVETDILILGAGLTGLTLNYLLKDSGYQVMLAESRSRIGGRIHTLKGPNEPTVEMGATWFGTKHRHLVQLMKELGVGCFPQELGESAIYEYMSSSPPQLVTLPENDEPSFRIKGGTSKLIKALEKFLSRDQLYLNTPIRHIQKEDDGLLAKATSLAFKAKYIVSTLPPNLFKIQIATTPQLPPEVLALMGQTHTWMGESIKFALTFPKPFWKEQGSSGTVFSNTGPVTEMYDHSDVEQKHHALKGFVNSAYYTLTENERKQLVLVQLKKYYGQQVEGYKNYYEKVWAKEKCTYTPYPDHVLPHQNNGNPIFRQSLLEGRLFLAGSETASAFPGYMDGAVESARLVKEELIKNLKS